MKKAAGSVLLVGAMLAMGAGVAEKPTEEAAVPAGDSLRESLYLSDHSSSLLRLTDSEWATDDSRYDPILLADAAAPAGGPNVSVMANNNEVMVGVEHNFSTWSDMTAIFRPSRWRNPFRQGGSLSWLNYKAWGAAPGRTAKVLLGEAIVAGAGYAIYEATQDDDDDNGDSGGDTTPAPTPSTSSSSSSSGDTSSSSSSGDTSSSSSSSSGDTSSSSSSGDTSSSSSSGDTSSSSSSGDTSSSSSSGELPF